jgi:hypothetical protein
MGDEAVEDEEASNWRPRVAAIAAMTTRPATRIQRIRIRRVVGARAWLL